MLKKKILMGAAAILVAAGLAAGCGGDQQAGGKTDSGSKIYKVGIVQLVEHPALDAANKGFVEGLASKGFKDNVKFDQQNAQADQSNLNTIAQRFVSEKDDLILAIATPAAQAVANATKDIPIVGTAITDYEAARLVQSNQHPGGNVTGTTDMNPVEKQVDLMVKLVPGIKTIGTIYTSSEVNSQVQVDKMKKYAESKGLRVVEATVTNVNDIQQAAQNLTNQGVQAIYVPTDNILASAMPNLVKVTNEARIPVFPAEEGMVKAGGVATYSVDYYKLGFQTGIMAADILSGKSKPADMPIEGQKDMKLIINKEEAQQLGITIPDDLLKEVQQ